MAGILGLAISITPSLCAEAGTVEAMAVGNAFFRLAVAGSYEVACFSRETNITNACSVTVTGSMTTAALWALLNPQSLCVYPASQVHTPDGEHLPCLLHKIGQVFIAQFKPRYPSAHSHTPSVHLPRPEQSSGQALIEQSAPMNGFSHTHLKFAHVP